ncbi:MAG: hypothetical protein EBU90_07345 [Proteobacteria bacterium]|nr:hypothetical protein [Pseudomonadota bacterium]NBP13482.1 hypothetical protein [bacterium]
MNTFTDEELESCIDGSSDINMIREILAFEGMVDEEGYVDSEKFADSFARAIEGLISEDIEHSDWSEAWDNNWNWGFDIADNINMMIMRRKGELSESL